MNVGMFVRRYKKSKHVPTGIDQPDYFCFMAYAVFILAQVYKKWPEAKKVDFVVSRKQGVTHHLGEFKEELQRFVESPLQDLVGDLIPASMEDRIPLQSADVLLWHLQRYYAAGRDQYKMNPVDRMRTAELIQDGKYL